MIASFNEINNSIKKLYCKLSRYYKLTIYKIMIYWSYILTGDKMKKLFKKAIAMCRDLPLNFVIVELSLYQREDGSSDNIKWISKRILEVTVTDQQWIYHLRMLDLPKLKPMSLASSDCPAREG
ncbi:hypothetical protein HMPREF9171_1594 [Streptococcus agalactiae ATCC 13813]|nr:hypothetical protein HMPREF9171_1594 [Streptococcus agalactiae ATCC 13813]